MLIVNLPFENLPQVKLSDPVGRLLELVSEYRVQELAVVGSDGRLKGLIREDVLLNADAHQQLKEFQPYLLQVSVALSDHLLKALAVAATSNLSILPVVDQDNQLKGVIETRHLLQDIADFMEVNEPGALIALEIDPQQYSLTEINRIVESNDAQIMQLNTSRQTEAGKMQVTLKVSKLEVSDIVATFQRFEYVVKYYFGEELYTNELKDNFENLMSYLNV